MSSKRSPFVDVPNDLANRSDDPPKKSTILAGDNGRKRHQLEPPPSNTSHRMKYQQKISSKVNISSKSNNIDAEMRARQYKAEAYEAKVYIASQEQRMNALEQELEELRFFAAVEQGDAMESSAANTHNDPPPKENDPMLEVKQMTSEKDAELIECLATELEEMEKDLKQIKRQLKEERSKNKSLNEQVEMHSKSKLQLDHLQEELNAEKARNESLTEEISLLAVRRRNSDEWQAKEAELNKTIEDQQADLKKSKKNNVEVANTLREIEGAVVRLQEELDAEKLRNETLTKNYESVKATSTDKERWQKREAELKKKIERQQGELNKWKKDTADGVVIMKELEGALRKARADNADLRSKIDETVGDPNGLNVLHEELKCTRNERDEAMRELSSLREECNRLTEQSRDYATKYEQLVESNKETQGVLSAAQSQLEEKVEVLVQDLSQAKEREDNYQASINSAQNERDEALQELSSLREECDRLLEQSRDYATKYEQLVKSNEELKGVLSAAQSQVEERVAALMQDLSRSKEREVELKDSYQASIDRYTQQIKETDEMRSAFDDLSASFETLKIDLELKSSEMEELEEVHAASLEKHASELQASEMHAKAKMKELSSLQQKYQCHMMIFQSQIEALKESAINNSDGPEDEVRAEIDAKLQFLQMQDLGTDDSEKRRLEKEVSALRSHVSSAEGRESRLKQQILLLSEELSETDASYKKEISDLQQELAEMRAFSLSPQFSSVDFETRDSESGAELEIKRKQIENDALQDYVSQRWQAFDP